MNDVALPLVRARNVSHRFGSRRWLSRVQPVQAVSGLDLDIAAGEAVGVVGESGSGKSTLGRLLLGLIAPSEGTITFDGQPIDAGRPGEWRALRRRMQIVFQDPYGSLDPRRRVGAQIADGLSIHRMVAIGERRARVESLLETVGLAREHADRFAHEFSGGQRQRIGIARALAVRPDFLVADEPVSALDVSIQAQIVHLLARLRADFNLAMLFISHDLLVVRHLVDRVVVMYLGRVMEEGATSEVFGTPAHPYTRALLSATPRINRDHRRERVLLAGDPPSPSNPPSGCVFRTRCPHAMPACAELVPELRRFGGARLVACHRAEEIA